MCWVHFEEKDSWREDRKTEKERGNEGVGRQWQRNSEAEEAKEKRGIQVSVVDYACWAGQFDPLLVWGEKDTLGEKGQLSDRWLNRETERGKVWGKTWSIVIWFHHFSGSTLKLCRNHLVRQPVRFKRSADRLYQAWNITLCSVGWMWSKTTRLLFEIMKVKLGTAEHLQQN